MTVVRVGAGPGDPDRLTVRAVEVLGQATRVVTATPRLAALAARLVGEGVAVEVGAAPTDRLGEGPLVVHLVEGEGSDGGVLVDDLVLGLPVDASARVETSLIDLARARPLRGLEIVVTRATEQASDLARPLGRLGAEVVELPTIRIDPPADGGVALDAALARIATYDWLVVTSANGARAVVERLPDARRVAGVRLAAIGPATAKVLADAHLPADLVPPRFVAESLLDVFPAGSGRVLLARAAVARDTLPVGLRAAGWHVDVVEAYRTGPAVLDGNALARLPTADLACFTSPSTFEQLVAQARGAALPPALACIGPVTAEAVRRAGYEPAIEAGVHTIAGLVDAIVGWARTRS